VKIQLEQLSKHYADVVAVDGVDVVLPSGKVTAVVGPSGSGKSSLLNLVAGLLRPTAGRILFDERDVTNVPPEKRNIGYVFQSYALFPHLTVSENVGFGVEEKAHRQAVSSDLMRRFRIEHLAARRPQELSGGERQRVALARALAREPQILLLDEPLSALDAQLREELRREISIFFHEFDRTTLYVTHDRQEAMLLADHVLVMRQGRVVQAGSPSDLYRQPSNAFVATFFGDANLIRGTIEAARKTIETPLGRFAVSSGSVAAGAALLILRPEMFVLANGDPDLVVTVERAGFLGPRWRIEGRSGEHLLLIDLPANGSIARGQILPLAISQQQLHVLATEDDSGDVPEETRDSCQPGHHFG